MTNQKSFDDLNLKPIDEVAAMLFCSERTLQRAKDAGKVDIYKCGSKRVVDVDMAKAWFLSKKQPARSLPKPKRGAPRKR